MFATFWPFDYSCSGFAFFALLMLGWLLYSLASAAQQAAGFAGRLAESEAVQEVGRGALAAWIDSFFRK